MPEQFELRSAMPGDALCIGALATQVFFDTYATSGMNLDLASEAQENYSEGAYARRLAKPGIQITVAERGGNLAGFIDVQSRSTCPVPAVVGPEVLRLYVQSPFLRLGLGTELLRHAERQSKAQGAREIWLTAWVDNARALAFYPTVGYSKVGTALYAINGKNYENHVFPKQLAA